MTKMFLDIYMDGVGDNEEAPAIHIVRSKVGMRNGHREESWGWGLEVTDDEEGRRVAVGRWGGPARDLLPNTSVPFS